MTTVVKFSALYGAMDLKPLCYLLELDQCKILLDCGWDDTFDVQLLEPLRKVAPHVDCVLLSHPDTAHLGAIPYAVRNLGLDCPIYATVPVSKMGVLFMYDLCLSVNCNDGFSLFNLDDIDYAFEKVVELKYSQHFKLKGKGTGITVTAYASGRTLGGAVWKIGKETEDIVYAVDYNHKRERHLSGTVLETLNRPSLLITDAFNAMHSHPNRATRDNALYDCILRTLRNGGDVLMPVDTAGRVLELLQILNTFWNIKQLLLYSLVLYNKVAFEVLKYAQSHVEWLSDSMQKQFEVGRDNPFNLKFVHTAHNMEELLTTQGPRVIVASMASLNTGNAKDLFLQLASVDKNLILFTDRGTEGSFTSMLLRQPPPTHVVMPVERRVYLEGEERESFLTEKAARRKKEQKAMGRVKDEHRHRDTTGVVPMMSDTDSEEELDPEGYFKHDLMAFHGVGASKKGGFFKKTDSFPMFPDTATLKTESQWDEYGEVFDLAPMRLGDIAVDIGLIEENKMRNARGKMRGSRGPMFGADRSLPGMGQVDAKPIRLMPPPGRNHPRAAPTPVEEEAYTVETHEQEVAVRATIKYIDLEGRSDGRSMKKILNTVKPRKLILIHGTRDATTMLRQHCVSDMGMPANCVFSPEVGHAVDLTSDTMVYGVRLKDAIVSSLKFSKVDDYEIAYVQGHIDRPSLQEVPSLEAVPMEECAAHEAAYIGDVQLSQFKKVLADNGFDCAFFEGVLVVNNEVGLKKVEGQMKLEGAFSKTYFAVRDLLYAQYHMI